MKKMTFGYDTPDGQHIDGEKDSYIKRADVLNRIQNRTSFITIDEFNEYFTLVINKLFPDKIGDTIFSSGKYSIYDRELNITISMAFNIDDYLSKKYKLIVVTILSGRKSDNKTVKILDI